MYCSGNERQVLGCGAMEESSGFQDISEDIQRKVVYELWIGRHSGLKGRSGQCRTDSKVRHSVSGLVMVESQEVSVFSG